MMVDILKALIILARRRRSRGWEILISSQAVKRSEDQCWESKFEVLWRREVRWEACYKSQFMIITHWSSHWSILPFNTSREMISSDGSWKQVCANIQGGIYSEYYHSLRLLPSLLTNCSSFSISVAMYFCWKSLSNVEKRKVALEILFPDWKWYPCARISVFVFISKFSN